MGKNDQNFKKLDGLQETEFLTINQSAERLGCEKDQLLTYIRLEKIYPY